MAKSCSFYKQVRTACAFFSLIRVCGYLLEASDICFFCLLICCYVYILFTCDSVSVFTSVSVCFRLAVKLIP